MMNPLFLLPLLGYNFGDVEPMMSAATIETHYTKHTQAYFDNLNRIVPGTRWEGMSLEEIAREATTGPVAQNAGQAWNHLMFFEQFRPEQDAKQPSDELLQKIEQSFGTMEDMRQTVKKAATSLFGSGWVWLVMDQDNKLYVKQLLNDDNPLRHGWKPVLVIDVWEHAYYLDYRKDRKSVV